MESILVTIQDEVRDERVEVSLRVSERLGDVIRSLVDMFQLPRYTFLGQEIYYDLYRQGEAGQPLPQARTVAEIGLQAGEVLRLVSPEGRRVWQQIQDLIDKIKDQIKDQIEDQVKEWIEEQLEKLRRTQGEKEKVSQLQEQYRHALHHGAGKPAVRSGPRLSVFAALATIAGVAMVGVVLIVTAVIALSALGVIELFPGPSGGSGNVPPAEPFEEPSDGGEILEPEDPDPDGDGLFTDEEYQIGTDPFNPDTDDDGLWDGDELALATDPLWWDTDGDEYSDGDEVNHIGSDPLDPNDPGSGEPPTGSDPFGESIFPLLEAGYTRFAILQVQNAPAEPVEISTQRITENGGELVSYQIFEGTDPYPAMTATLNSEPEVVLLYSHTPDVLNSYERILQDAMFKTGLDYAYFYAIFADGTGYEWYRP